jgi:hypothetical protein
MMTGPSGRKWAKVVVGMVAAIVLVAATLFVIATQPFRDDSRVEVPPRQTFTRGSYYSYVAPWGGESSVLTRSWSARADSMWIDLHSYPDNTRIDWRWPPFSPRNGVGVWGYNHIGYGFYDGGQPEKPVPARRVGEVRKLNAHYRWDGDFGWGEATVLLELYLRSNPTDSDAKVIEIGWLLHVPPKTRSFLDEGRKVGTYRDTEGQEWRVILQDKYCTFSLVSGADSRSGTVDVPAALAWLKGKKLVRDELWLTGLALGAEPVSGAGHVEIARWHVDWP